jgi:hypothetical protein
MSPTIDFCIVGAAKSATTSLHFYLAQHPDLFLPTVKELAFFIAPANDPREKETLATHYASIWPNQKVGLSHSNMLMFPHVPSRIDAHNRNARVIALLRNPVERAYSNYWFARLRGWDDAPTFEDALSREVRGEETLSFDRIKTYLRQGHYAEQLERFVAVLGRDRVRILLTEDLAANPGRLLTGLHAWLGVTPRDDLDLELRHNVTHPRFPWVDPWIGRFAGQARRLVPSSWRTWVSRCLVRPLRAYNQVCFTRPPMPPETRAWLRGYYRSHNVRLGQLLDRDLSHWDEGGC